MLKQRCWIHLSVITPSTFSSVRYCRKNRFLSTEDSSSINLCILFIVPCVRRFLSLNVFYVFQGGTSFVNHLCYLCFVLVSWSTSELRLRLVHCQTGLSSPVKYFTDLSKAVLLLWIFNVFFCLVFTMPLYTSDYMCLVVTCLEGADLLALVCGVLLWVCYFPIGILGKVWYLIVSIPDLCTLTYFMCGVLLERLTPEYLPRLRFACHFLKQ